MANRDNGPVKKHWSRTQANRREAERIAKSRADQERMTQSATSVNGPTYTILKPAYADGTESAEDWTRYNI